MTKNLFLCIFWLICDIQYTVYMSLIEFGLKKSLYVCVCVYIYIYIYIYIKIHYFISITNSITNSQYIIYI